MQEIWKDIEEYKGIYQVSNFGDVKSLERKINRHHNAVLNLKERKLKQLNVNGYMTVALSKKNNRKQTLIHRLVAEAFIPDKSTFKSMPDEDRDLIVLDDLEVNHKDENKANNIVMNLEWCTHKYNINYGDGNKNRSATEKQTKSSSNYSQRYNGFGGKKRAVLQYDLQNNFIKEWQSITEASKTLGLKKIWEVCNGKRNKCGNCIWKYKEED